MRLSLSFRNLLPAIVLEELDALVAKIIGGWNIEHKSTGGHGDITADTLTFLNGRDEVIGTVDANADVSFDGGLTLGDDAQTTGDVIARQGQSTSFTGSGVTGSAEVEVGGFTLGGDASEGGSGIAFGNNTGSSETGSAADWVLYKNVGTNPHTELRLWTSSQTAGANHLIRFHKPSGTFMVTPHSSTTVQLGDATFGRWGGLWSTTGSFSGSVSTDSIVGFTYATTGLTWQSASQVDVQHSGTSTINFFGVRSASNLSAGITVPAQAVGTGAKKGGSVVVGRNSSGNGAAGHLVLQDKNGNLHYIWPDVGGTLRIHSAGPTEDGTTVSDTAGTVVGTQT